jgi:WD40 repeat protein
MRRKVKLLKNIVIWLFICEFIFINGSQVFILNGWGIWGEKIDGNEKIHTYTPGSEVGTVESSSDGQYFITKGGNMLYFFNRSNQTPLWNYTSGGSGNTIRSISISSDGEYIVTGSDTMWVCLFNKDNSTPLWHYVKSPFSPSSVAISSNGQYIAAGLRSGSGAEGSVRYGEVCLFNRTNSIPLWNYTIGEWILSVAISANGQYIVAGGLDNKVYFFNKTNTTPLWSYETAGRVNSIEISSDGQYTVAGTYENKVYLFNNTSSTPLWNYSAGSGYKSLAISSGGQHIVVGGTSNGNVYFFNYTSHLPLWVYNEGEYSKKVAMSSDGQYAVIGRFDGIVSLLDSTSKTILWDYRVGQHVGGLTISSDGKYVLAEDNDIIYLIPTSYKPPPNYSFIWSIIIICTGLIILAIFLYSLYYIIFKREIHA